MRTMILALLSLVGFTDCSGSNEISLNDDCSIDSNLIQANAARDLGESFAHQGVTRFNPSQSAADRVLDAQATIEVYDCRNDHVLSILRQSVFASEEEAQSSEIVEASLISGLVGTSQKSLKNFSKLATSLNFDSWVHAGAENPLMKCACDLFHTEMQGATQ